MTVPLASKPFVSAAVSVTEPPVRIVEAVRLVVRDGDALPTEIVIVTE